MLTKHQFYELFSESLDLWEPLFEILKGCHDTADIYQSVCMLLVYSNINFQDKLYRMLCNRIFLNSLTVMALAIYAMKSYYFYVNHL